MIETQNFQIYMIKKMKLTFHKKSHNGIKSCCVMTTETFRIPLVNEIMIKNDKYDVAPMKKSDVL